jgi:hypothetical protein
LNLSNKLIRIPKAQVKPPPAKSAKRLIGGVGFSSFLPSLESTPKRD